MQCCYIFRLAGPATQLAVYLAISGLVAGCTVGPQYSPPTPPANNAYNVPSGTSNVKASLRQQFKQNGRIGKNWYRVFGSHKLNHLINRALKGNPDLAAGQARIVAARQLVNVHESARRPHVGVSAGVSRNRASGASFGISSPQFVNVFNLYQGQISASYDLDLFGKTRRRIEASKARFDRRRFRVANTYMTLVDNVVATAITEAGLNASIQTTHKIAKLLAHKLQHIQNQIQQGAAIKADATPIRTELAQTRASLAPLKRQKAVTVDRLATLVGKPPGQFNDPDFRLANLKLPATLPVSAPSQLVKNRPDIRAAASTLHAASAEVGVATANMLPNFSITGSYGRTALHPSNFADPAAVLYQLGINLTAPLFEGGRLHAQTKAAKARYQAAAADYRATEIKAFEQVANGLKSLQADARALHQRKMALSAAQTNLKTVKHQLNNGAADSIDQYTAAAQYQNARLAYTNARARRYRDTARLFRDLGGGWPHQHPSHIASSGPHQSQSP